MLAVSMLDMACKVYSLREPTWRRRGCLLMGLTVDQSTEFKELIRLMKDSKYLCVCVCVCVWVGGCISKVCV